MVVGLATVHSASSELLDRLSAAAGRWIGIGLILMLVAFSIDYQLLLAFAWPLYGLSILSLVLILILGHEAGGARSWLGVGGFGGQPAEFAKLATALIWRDTWPTPISSGSAFHRPWSRSAITLVPMLLIAAERDLGSAAMFVPLAAACWRWPA